MVLWDVRIVTDQIFAHPESLERYKSIREQLVGQTFESIFDLYNAVAEIYQVSGFSADELLYKEPEKATKWIQVNHTSMTVA